MRVRMRGAESLLRMDRILLEGPSQKPKMLRLLKKKGETCSCQDCMSSCGVEPELDPGSQEVTGLLCHRGRGSSLCTTTATAFSHFPTTLCASASWQIVNHLTPSLLSLDPLNKSTPRPDPYKVSALSNGGDRGEEPIGG